MKPIEKGCLAMCIGSSLDEYLGYVVTVGDFLGDVDGHGYDDLWEIFSDRISLDGYKGVVQRETNLLRIDDPDQHQTKETEKEIVG